MESRGVMNLEGFGIDLEHGALGPAGAVLVYAEDVLKGKPGNLKNLEEWKGGDLLLLDPATQRNLEVFKTTANTRVGSLLDVMDQTSSAAGSRLLERFLGAPEKDLDEILRRQSAVKDFSSRPSLVSKIEEIFKSGSDIERILGRLQNRMARPREVGVRTMLRGLPALKKILLEVGAESAPIQALADGVSTFDPLRNYLSNRSKRNCQQKLKSM